MIRRLLLVVLVVLMPATALAAEAMRGVALVIGQSKYGALPALANPSKDARDIDRLLGDLGFEVDRVLNADGDELREAIARFEDEAKGADVALIYYSGHGIEAKGANYIAPIDTDLSSPESAGASLVAVQPILDAMSKIAPVSIVLLDACRSDPFPPGTQILLPGDSVPTPVEGTGLAEVRGPAPVKAASDPASLGTVIGFAAEPGRPALDGAPGENSPYAAALLKHFAAGGYSFGDVMTMVTEEVYLKTHAKQLPWTNSSLRRVLTFAAAPGDEDADRAAIKTERRKLLLSIAGTPAPTQKFVETLAGQENVPLDALYGMLEALGVKTSDDGGDLQKQLEAGAERLKQLLAQKSDAVKADPELERLSKLADEAETEGAIGLALKYRNDASARADVLLGSKQAEAARLKQDMLDIAATYAANAATALLNFKHAEAATLYGKAFDAVKDWDADEALDYKINEADALSDASYYTADNAAGEAALAAYALAESMAPKSSTPQMWAMLEDRIGQAKQVLGERVADPAMLEQSVEHYRAALTIRTVAATPLDWAKSQNNLANALFTLGARRNDLGLLHESIPAFEAALTVFTRENEPVRWATVINNIAASQTQIGTVTYAATSDAEMAAALQGITDPTNIPEVRAARDAANAAFDKAISAARQALSDDLRANNPLDWAMLQHTLATALLERGEINHDADAIRDGVAAYRAVLEVHTREQMPAQWLRTTNNLAIALKELSDQTSDAEPLRQAIGLYQQVVAATSRAQSPLDWADYEVNLGNALAVLTDYDKDQSHLADALAAYMAASEVITLDRSISKWQQLRIGMSTTLLMQALGSFDKSKAVEAKRVAEETRDALEAKGASVDFFAAYLPQVDKVIALFP